MKNHPVVGDDIYGKANKNLKGQLLHSYKLEFIHPIIKETMCFEVELPNYFKDFISKLKKEN